jgi:hypothetical protein
MFFTQTMEVQMNDEAAVATRNNERAETHASAAKLGDLVTGAPEYRAFRLVCTTEAA